MKRIRLTILSPPPPPFLSFFHFFFFFSQCVDCTDSKEEVWSIGRVSLVLKTGSDVAGKYTQDNRRMEVCNIFLSYSSHFQIKKSEVKSQKMQQFYTKSKNVFLGTRFCIKRSMFINIHHTYTTIETRFTCICWQTGSNQPELLLKEVQKVAPSN